MRGLIVLLFAISALIFIGRNAKAAEGMASHYGRESGPHTASGQRFDPSKLTCAMRTYAWRWVTVTNLRNGKAIRCWVNDFGPAAWTGRIIDISTAGALELGFHAAGVTWVRVE